MSQFLNSIIEQVKTDYDLSGKTGVLIGLSGGPDSVFLTNLFHTLAEDIGFRLHLAHVNYRLRGRESDQEEDFCRKLAEKLSLPIDIRVADLSKMKRESGNIQSEARVRRMSFFNELLEKHGLNLLALGHTLDDNAETVLGNIIRGCGLGGLSGIGYSYGNIIRPLRNMRKSDLLAYLDENKIEYKTDSSNLESDYTRNKIRNKLIPLLEEEYNPEVVTAIDRLSQIAGEVDKFMNIQVDGFLTMFADYSYPQAAILPLANFANLKKIVMRYVLKELTARFSTSVRTRVSYDLIDEALKLVLTKDSVRADLSDNVMVERSFESIIVFRPEFEAGHEEIKLPGSSVLEKFGMVLHGEEAQPDQFDSLKGDNWQVLLDKDKLNGDMNITRFSEGQRFRPLGMSDDKKLGDFFTDRKVPRAIRDRIPILMSGDETAWIIGYEISDRFKIDANTKHALKLWVQKSVKNVE